MNHQRWSVFLLVVGVLASGCLASSGVKGQQAPDFSVTDTEGKVITLKSFEGKPVVIMFGAAYGCESCRAFSKNVLAPLARDTNGSVGLLMLSVVPSDTDQDLRQLKADVGATWPHALDTDRVAERYGVRALTTVVVLDKDHAVVLQEVEPSGSKVRQSLGL